METYSINKSAKLMPNIKYLETFHHSNYSHYYMVI